MKILEWTGPWVILAQLLNLLLSSWRQNGKYQNTSIKFFLSFPLIFGLGKINERYILICISYFLYIHFILIIWWHHSVLLWVQGVVPLVLCSGFTLVGPLGFIWNSGFWTLTSLMKGKCPTSWTISMAPFFFFCQAW